jgi:hypothetical protein
MEGWDVALVALAVDWLIYKTCQFQTAKAAFARVLLGRNRLPVHNRYFFHRPQGGTCY